MDVAGGAGRVLGVSCDFHDAAACLVVDGQIVAAAEEERYSRQKHDPELPARAILACLARGGVVPDDLDVVVYHEKPLLTVTRYLATRQRIGPRAVPGFVRTFPHLISHNLLIRYRIGQLLARLGASRTPRICFSEHHLSHASAAFLPSPFESSAVLTVDGLGEWATASYGQGVGNRIDLLGEQRFPDSLGLLYSLVTLWCGFEPNDGEYKVMGLAPFGEPAYVEQLERIARPNGDGSIRVDARAVRWWSGDPRRSRRLSDLLGGPARRRDEPLGKREADLARSVQVLTEDTVLAAARRTAAETGQRRLCLAGGVALNCVANRRLLDEGPFEDVWVQPAAGDAGSALGAALWYWHVVGGNERRRSDAPLDDAMAGSALGSSFSSQEIATWRRSRGIAAAVVPDVEERCATVAERLAQGQIVGWFEGPMEFGPRALGHRSILADPRSETAQRDINLRVKGRESFRPFAPSVLWERAAEWFDIDRPSPYMTFTHRVADHRLRPVEDEPAEIADRVAVPRSELPACTHIDGTARVQTVHREQHPVFHRLLEAFEERTGCPVLLNTSFNRAGEPIVCTPEDALESARVAGLDLLVLEDHLVDLRAERLGA